MVPFQSRCSGYLGKYVRYMWGRYVINVSEKWAHSNGKPRKVENNLKMIMPKSLLTDWLRLFKTYSLLEDS